MLGIDDVRHQDISVGEQKICTRQLNGQLVPQAVDQLIDRVARSELCESIDVHSEHSGGLSIED